MKALLFAILVLPLLAARAHVGSPNVFFEGNAGPYPLRIVIRPPATLPGIAQVDVRVTGEDTTRVTLQAAPWEARDDAAPAPVPATPVAGEAGLYNAPLWLLTTGSYRVRITIESPRGTGTVAVPLNSAAIQRPTMPPVLGLVLASLGASLFIGAVLVAGATARDATVDPGAVPSIRDQRRGRVATVLTALLLTAAVYSGTRRWQTMDREFRNNALYQPVPIEATIRNAGPLRLLHLAPSRDTVSSMWDTLVADHGKLMHLFLVREPDFTAFAHLHPIRRDSGAFENVLPPLPAGTYQLYAEITHENGLNQTLTARLAVPAPSGPALPPMADWKMVNEIWCRSPGVPTANAGQPFALDADDSWQIGASPAKDEAMRTQVSLLADGGSMVFLNAGGLVANREASLRFSVITASGRHATLQPYMGMLGHAVVRRMDGAVFTHLHPAGTVSMAATELLAMREPASSKPTSMPIATGGEVTFPYAFPRDGEYRIWVQVRVDGQVQTGVFDAKVGPPQ
jgi:hypothetical protein